MAGSKDKRDKPVDPAAPDAGGAGGKSAFSNLKQTVQHFAPPLHELESTLGQVETQIDAVAGLASNLIAEAGDESAATGKALKALIDVVAEGVQSAKSQQAQLVRAMQESDEEIETGIALENALGQKRENLRKRIVDLEAALKKIEEQIAASRQQPQAKAKLTMLEGTRATLLAQVEATRQELISPEPWGKA